ncbi:hypothetical protein, partial [Thalassospira xiamenensis]|uniref:hypothetical protein n=1 Tax=Thalassospira xiamenensis TaxID=220697 RepID=UPI00242021D9
MNLLKWSQSDGASKNDLYSLSGKLKGCYPVLQEPIEHNRLVHVGLRRGIAGFTDIKKGTVMVTAPFRNDSKNENSF